MRSWSDAWIAAARAPSAVRIEAAPRRAPFPAGWTGTEPAEPRGRVIYLRRTNEQGEVTFLRQRLPVAWPSGYLE